MISSPMPSKEEIGVYDGSPGSLDAGETISWRPPVDKPNMPDPSTIKSLARYFGRTGLQIFPAWLYHPALPPRLVATQEEALLLGICYKRASLEEQARYGCKSIWWWEPGCEWRPLPEPGWIKFNPLTAAMGKTYIAPADAPIVKAFAQGKEWEEFQQFLAWKKLQAPSSEPAAKSAK